MSTFLHALSAVGLIIVMAAFGFLMGRLGWMGSEHKKFLSRLIIRVGVPCLTVKNMLSDITPELLYSSGKLLLVAFLSLSATLLLSLLVAKLLKLPKRRFGVFVAMGAFSNTIFIGYPICVELFGEAAVSYVMLFYVGNTIMFWTAGELLIRFSGEEHAGFSLSRSLKGLLTPPLITLAACMALLALNFRLPPFLQSLANYMSGMVTPLGLIYVGYTLYETGFKNIRITADLLLVLLLRFVAAPLSIVGLCALFNVAEFPRDVFVMEASMPVMTQCVALSGATGADDSYAAVGMSLSTLACIIAIPLLTFL